MEPLNLPTKIAYLLCGLILSFIVTFVGSYLFSSFFLKQEFFGNLASLFKSDLSGKIISIGSLLNIPVVYGLLSKKKYQITRGVITGLISLVIISQII